MLSFLTIEWVGCGFWVNRKQQIGDIVSFKIKANQVSGQDLSLLKKYLSSHQFFNILIQKGRGIGPMTP
jgi:hypothetical protein